MHRIVCAPHRRQRGACVEAESMRGQSRFGAVPRELREQAAVAEYSIVVECTAGEPGPGPRTHRELHPGHGPGSRRLGDRHIRGIHRARIGARPRKRLRGGGRDRAGIEFSRRPGDTESTRRRLARDRFKSCACRNAAGHRPRCARAQILHRPELQRSDRPCEDGEGAQRHLRRFHGLRALGAKFVRELESDPHPRPDAGQRCICRAICIVAPLSVPGQNQHRR